MSESQKRSADVYTDSEIIDSNNKKVKIHNYSYLEHRIKKEYGGNSVKCVDDSNTLNDESSSDCESDNDKSSGEKVELKDEDSRSISGEDFTSEGMDTDKLDLSELEELLDEKLPNEYKKPASGNLVQKFNDRKNNGDFIELEKVLLDNIGDDHFDLLPEGWIQMMHCTGMPVYLYRPARVCTLARPYFLGSGNIYNHKIPLSAIPCLQYRRALEKSTSSIVNAKIEDCTRLIGNLRVPITKIETVVDNQRSQSLDAEEVRDYCKKLFKYKKVYIKRNKNVKRNTEIAQSQNFRNRPSLPAGTKLLSFTSLERDANGEIVRRREWIMNPSGKSYIAILHEYLQQALKMQPHYQYKQSENEYEAFVTVEGVVYGKGTGASKKEAKLLAAKGTLEILIPELDGKTDEIFGANFKRQINSESTALLDSNNIFDEIKITDPRVQDFCARTTEPSPYAMLLTCLRRNCGSADIVTDYTVSLKHNKNNDFTMAVGKHTVAVSCRNKRDGKQKAAQAILQALHPQLKTWGSLVRLYGNRSVKNSKEKKLEEQEITQLQMQAKFNSPNYAILDKLNIELEKLHENKKKIKPVGKFIIADVPKNSGANLNPLNYS